MDENTNQPITDADREQVAGLTTNLLRLISNPSPEAVARGVDEPLIEYAREVLAERDAEEARVQAWYPATRGRPTPDPDAGRNFERELLD